MDTIDLLVLTCLLVCIACSLYTLGVVWRLLVEIWYAFCHVANTIDRAVIHAVDTWRHKNEAKREAPKVPNPLPAQNPSNRPVETTPAK